eukprot:Hpha_TRINITY_DN9780_c0_g1::TRINITY_DN9780_c0_g1_i1::g.10282::m.10282/K01562/DIO1; type I thyroxine 5'-deiodinase
MFTVWQHHADFLHIYLREAHAVDEWPLGSRVVFQQHNTQAERIECATQCWADLQLNMPCVTDHIDNDFNNAYAAWPERFFVIHGGKMRYIAYPKNAVYDPHEVVQCLLKITTQK